MTDVDELMPFIPSSTQGSIIITTRRHDLDVPGSSRFEVPSLTPVSGAELLSNMVEVPNDRSLDEAREISCMLDGLPLALVSIASYVRRTQIPLSELIRSFKQFGNLSRDVFASNATSIWQYGKSLSSAFTMALNSLSTESKELLDIMAMMDPDEIPETLLFEHYDSSSHAKPRSDHE